ncbi:hypothetical protein [Pseudarthrobacter sp. NPDC058119]|uniref:hypothetical protein n=1 Tax=Pseudarthrobacter sp. NPDC058119 TaxID=3346348 RepID=UPI0036DA3432
MTEKPEEADAQQNADRGSDDEVIAEALRLLADFDNTSLPGYDPAVLPARIRRVTDDYPGPAPDLGA